MRTQVMQDVASGTSYLEFFPIGGSHPERYPLDRLPFSIGRDESADLRLESNRVSREHAVIQSDGRTCRVRDLGSTNGTYLNGKRIAEAVLHDGDVVIFADLEFTFFSNSAPGSRSTATQVLDQSAAPRASRPEPINVVHAVRRLQEILVRHAVTAFFQPIVRMSDSQLFAYDATMQGLGGVPGVPLIPTCLERVECHLNDQLHRVFRRVALDDALHLPAGTGLFLSLHPTELGAPAMIESLERFQQALGGERKLVVTVPDEQSSELPYFSDLRQRLFEAGIHVACRTAELEEPLCLTKWETLPEYVKLDLTSFASAPSTRRSLAHLPSIVTRCRELDVRLVVEGISAEPEARTCKDAGCQYAQGVWFGAPQPVLTLQEARRA